MKNNLYFKGLRIFRNADNILRTKKVCQPTPIEYQGKSAISQLAPWLFIVGVLHG